MKIYLLVLVALFGKVFCQDCTDTLDQSICDIYYSAGFCVQQNIQDVCGKTCNPSQCSDVECTDLPLIPSDGSNTPSGTTFAAGTIVTYNCSDNYVLVGPEVNICLQNGNWNETTAPTCEPECPAPPTDPELSISPIGPYKSGDTIMYDCIDPTATLSGPYTSTCNGTHWSLTDLPDCETSDACGPPPMIASGGINPESRDYANGDSVSYACNPRRLMAGFGINTCSEGEWSNAAPFCYQDCVDQQDCSVNVQFGYCGFPSYAEYNEEYCTKSCDLCLNCPAPPAGDGVTVSPAGPYVQGQIVNYTCENGNLFGYNQNLCLDDETWFDTVGPICSQTDCINLPTDPNGVNTPAGTNHDNGTVVKYNCSEGYLRLPPYENTCNDGVWSESEAGQCLLVCDFDPDFDIKLGFNLIVPDALLPYEDQIGTLVPGVVLNFNCTMGRLEGVSTLECLSNGSISAPFPVCLAECDPFPALDELLELTYNEPLHHTEEVFLQCAGLATMDGANTLTCLENGSWAGVVFPTCTAECGPAPISNALELITDPGTTTEGSMIEYGCINGTIMGDATSTCESSGNWSITLANLPTCVIEAQPCQATPLLTGGDFTTSNTSNPVGTMIQYSCNSGYIKSGTDDTNECIGNGEWMYPTVTEVSCISPKLLGVFDGNKDLDQCSEKELNLGSGAPHKQTAGGVLTRANFPIYFDQIDRFNALGDWLSENSNSLFAIHQHSGSCTVSNGFFDVVMLFNETDYNTSMHMMEYECNSWTLSLLFGCAIDHQYAVGAEADANYTVIFSENIVGKDGNVLNFGKIGANNFRSNNPNFKFLTVSALPSNHANFSANAEYLSEIACGSGVTSGCKYFLGSMYDDVDADGVYDFLEKLSEVDFEAAQP